MKPLSDKKNGMSLVELILAVLLLNVVILTGISMELGMRRVYTSSDTEAQLLGEAAPIMAMLTKHINRGIGELGNLPYNTNSLGGGLTFRIHLDTNANGVADAADIWAGYSYLAGNYELRLYPNAAGAGFDVLSGRVTEFFVGNPVTGVFGTDSNGTVLVRIRLRKNPPQAVSYLNPEVTVTTTAQFRAYSIS